MMKIAELYQMLCRLYGIKSPIEIEHYLVSVERSDWDVEVGNRFPGREALFIKQSGDDLELGLFIDSTITDALEYGGAIDHLDELSCAIEGVSHFLYVTDRAEKERRVSKLELELQGEVDKFILVHLIASGESAELPRELFARQFEDHRYDSTLDSADLELYSTANHFAAKYCSQLRSTCFNPLRPSALLAEAREFFDGDLSSKLKRLIP